MKNAIPLGLTLLVLLAGCAGGAKPAATSATPTPDTDHGVLSGLVLDAESRPLSGADVGLRGTGFTGRTDTGGRFHFGGLEPKTYTLDVVALGFIPTAQQVQVKAGETTRVELFLVALPPVEEVYYESYPFTGFYECALGTTVWVSPCSYPYTAAYLTLHNHGVNLSQYGPFPSDIQNNQWRYNFSLKPGAVEVVSELSWIPTQPSANRLMLIVSCADYDPVLDDCSGPTYVQKAGTSPINGTWDAKRAGELPAWVMTRVYLPWSGAQVALSQRFDVWNTVFFNGKAPEGFTMVEPPA
jgi:hypothetical protein